MASGLLAVLAASLIGASQDPPGFWERETLLGDPGGTRTALAERGLTFTLALTGEVLSSVSGGQYRDTGADLLLDWVIDADLDKAFGWTGGSLRINPMWLAGEGISDGVGDLTLVSNINGLPALRVFEAWVQQGLFGNRLTFRAGIVAADQEFALTASGALFYNSVFGGPVFLTPNLAWPIYPVGALGARVKVTLGEQGFVQGAVYEGNPGSEAFNRSGLRVRLTPGEGVFLIAEGGWNFDAALPATFKAGLFHHTADFQDYASGTPRSGFTGGYVVFETKLGEGVDVFFRMGFAQPERSMVSLGIDSGILFTGLLPDRPADVLGLGLIYAHVGADFARSQPDASRWGFESILELTYKITFTRWWSLQPDLQFIIHPGGSTALPNALVLGLRIDLLF